jgi:hypothetical protein
MNNQQPNVATANQALNESIAVSLANEMIRACREFGKRNPRITNVEAWTAQALVLVSTIAHLNGAEKRQAAEEILNTISSALAGTLREAGDRR